MQKIVEGLLQQNGTAMCITSGKEERHVRAFLQPVQSKSWQNMLAAGTVLGHMEQGQYVYIGPGSVPVAPGDTLTVQDRVYEFRRAEPYYYAEEKIYLWGLCMEKGAVDTWGSQL